MRFALIRRELSSKCSPALYWELAGSWLRTRQLFKASSEELKTVLRRVSHLLVAAFALSLLGIRPTRVTGDKKGIAHAVFGE